MYEDALRTVPLFADLTESDLTELCRGIEQVDYAAGTELFAENDYGDHAYVVIAGEVEIVKVSGGRRVLLARLGSGAVIGELALLQGAPRMAGAVITADTKLLSIPKARIDELLASSATAARAMFGAVLANWRSTEGKLRQSERMAQLGTLSAGVAHELNNPAAAVTRSVDRLRAAVIELGEAHAGVTIAGLESDQRAALDDLVSGLLADTGPAAPLDALARSDQEAAIEDWLEDRAVPRAWDVAPALADLGFEPSDLDAIVERFDSTATTQVVHLVRAAHAVASLLHEIEEGTTRVSSIVRALKSYSYLDQAPIQDVDVAAGIEDTLLILGPKLAGIGVQREYHPGLPTIEAFGSELNQVWTNLIDNAADAVTATERDDGTIQIRVFPDGADLIVEVEDNGTGIPDEIRPRIFDSFFTTKAPGSGTGLGLDISYGIIVDRHRGDITVDSVPGCTVFRVAVPRQMERSAVAAED